MADGSIKRIISHINASPTPFHAVRSMALALEKKGFSQLKEEEPWQVEGGRRYFVIRDFSSLIAFVIPEGGLAAIPRLRLAGAHTDSPVLQVKPTPLKWKKDHLVWDVEIYGSPILSTWFDRDLSLAGLVGLLDETGEIHQQLIDFKTPLTRVPNLAIHLNREVNKGYAPNFHEELNPLFSSPADTEDSLALFSDLLKKQLAVQGVKQTKKWQILDWKLSFYDVQESTLSGLKGEWLVGARLDNLLSCFTGLEALLDHDDQETLPMLACFDHEEVGSRSATGAAGSFVESVLKRLLPNEENFSRTMASGRMISVDNAHGYHANFASKQDENDPPVLNGGIVLKYNANQRYSTHSTSGSWLRAICKQNRIAVQNFTVRSDMGCGSTIGPTLAAKLGISAIDIGVPTWAMHSIRETAGSKDIKSLKRLWSSFYSSK